MNSSSEKFSEKNASEFLAKDDWGRKPHLKHNFFGEEDQASSEIKNPGRFYQD